jgi:hypothetical protein
VRVFFAGPAFDPPKVDRVAARDPDGLLQTLPVGVVEVLGQPIHDALGRAQQS